MTTSPITDAGGPGWDVLRDLYSTRRARDLTGKEHELEIAGVPRETGAVLYGVIREFRPRRTLETGFAFGFSTLFILQALSENGQGEHIAIDPVETTRWHGIGLANVKRAGFSGIFNHLAATSQLALPSMLMRNMRLDFAFIDGSHLFDEALLDAIYVDRMLAVGGIMVIDDWRWMSGVRSAVNFIETNYPYEVLPFPDAPNVRVLRKIANNERPWNHFVPFDVPTDQELKARSRLAVEPVRSN